MEVKKGDLQAWSIANWNQIPEADRKRCLDHLRQTLKRELSGPAVLGVWRRQAAAGIEIGSDSSWFHFGAGMAVRNILRQVLQDVDLPAVDGATNWDDCYIGAIHALATEPEVVA